MYKFIVVIIIFFVSSLNHYSYGSSSHLFNFDEAIIELKLAQLSKVENEILECKNLSNLSVDSVMRKNALTDYAKPITSKKEFEDVDKLLTFGAGCVLPITGVVGVTLAYYLIYDDKELGRKALLYSSGGCLVTAAAYVAIILAFSVY